MTSQVTRILLGIGGLLLIACGTAQAQTTIRMEAEDMTLDTYDVEALSFASNGALINLKGLGIVGSVTASFSGDSGAYDITVAYHDENDGVAQLSVSIAGNAVDSWSLDQVIPGGQQPEEFNRFIREIATGYAISNGDEIRIDGLQGNWDHANVDYIEFVGSPAPPPASDNVATVAKSGGNYTDPVEALRDFDSWCDSPTLDDPCTLFIGPGRYEIQQELETKDKMNIVGAGEIATIVIRGTGASDCDAGRPMISHSSGITRIADLSILCKCLLPVTIIEQSGGELYLQRVNVGGFRPDTGYPTKRAIHSIAGRVGLDSATIDGRIIVESVPVSITNSVVTGGNEYGSPAVDLRVGGYISHSRFTVPHNTEAIENHGYLEINDSNIDLSAVSTGVENKGTIVVARTTIYGSGSTLIDNAGQATVHHSMVDSYVGNPSSLGGSGELMVTHSIIRNTTVSGDPICLFVSDGEGNELGEDCSTLP